MWLDFTSQKWSKGILNEGLFNFGVASLWQNEDEATPHVSFFKNLLFCVSFCHSWCYFDVTDPAPHLFRLRLTCVLLDTCGQYFDRGSTKKKLDYFLVYFNVSSMDLAQCLILFIILISIHTWRALRFISVGVHFIIIISLTLVYLETVAHFIVSYYTTLYTDYDLYSRNIFGIKRRLLTGDQIVHSLWMLTWSSKIH